MMDATTNVMFKCDRSKCKKCKNNCSHTSDIQHAVNGEIFKQDPLRFINLCCEPNVQVYSDNNYIQISYFETEVDPYAA